MNSDLQLARLEHKLNLLIEALQTSGLMAKDLPSLEGLREDRCPVCKQNQKLSVDYEKEKVLITCGCKLPITITKGISQLTEVQDATTSKRNVPEQRTGEISPIPQEKGPSNS